MIFDWVAKLLGWIEGQSRINAFSINSGTTDGIYTNLQQVDSLTIDSHNGLVASLELSHFHKTELDIYTYMKYIFGKKVSIGIKKIILETTFLVMKYLIF